VATDDARIAQVVESFGGIAKMTRSVHQSGLDRVAEVAGDLKCGIIVNVQGDEPLIEPGMIAEVIEPFARDPALQMCTLRRQITDPSDLTNPNIVKVVADRDGNAMYFSRAPLPFMRGSRVPAYKHIGLYAYRRSFLMTLASLPPTPLETAESLEQLRALEHGFRIRAIETRGDSIGVDTPEDLERVRRQIAVATGA
jgi:3-deoxy-manno-octulosonate cytidylyltransferase (CMP-KDO synthetase)